MSLFPIRNDVRTTLRERLRRAEILRVPGCYDALSARVLEEAGFEAGFLGGFAVSGTRLGLPDAGLLSYGESVDHGRATCAAVSLPLFADADTGYGNEVNVRRTVLGLAQAGFAGIMIEDQAWPKRCGHTAGKQVVARDEAVARVRAAVAARDDCESGPVIMARTDALATDGLEEALWRACAFADLGADLTFVEAPRTREEMRRYCNEVPGRKTANLVEDGRTPWLSPAELQDLGYAVVLYPLTLLLASLAALQRAAASLRGDDAGDASRARFEELQRIVGFPRYRELVAPDS